MALDWLAALRYGSGPTTWAASHPIRPWFNRRHWTGGTIEVASLVRESFTINRKRDLSVTFRVKESEEEAFLLAVDYGVENPGTVTFYPNGVAATGYPVNIISPTHGEDFQGAPIEGLITDGGRLFDYTLVLRKVDGTAWSLNYFAP